MKGMGGVSLGAAALLLTMATVAFGSTVVDALRVEGSDRIGGAPATAGASETSGGASSMTSSDRGAGNPYPRITEGELLEAVNRDLFQPDRSPPPQRYQLPLQGLGTPTVEEEARRSRGRGPELRLVGTAIMGDMAVALVQVDDSIPLAIQLGESIEGFTLAALDQETAVLVGENETLTLPVVAPLPTRGSRGVGPQVQMDTQDIEAMQERVQQMLRSQLMRERALTNRGRGGRGGGRP
jgi:hypothetical protein